MKVITLKKSVLQLYRQRQLQLGASICNLTLRPFAGEWVLYQFQHEWYLGFANSNVEKPSYHLVQQINASEAAKIKENDEKLVAQSWLQDLLQQAILYRLEKLPYGRHSRLVYGTADFLPGLIIDGYENAVLVQINTAGVDRFRDQIMQTLTHFFPQTRIDFLDDQKQRTRESLPIYSAKKPDEFNLSVHEGRLSFEIKKKYWQKNGYYYDHRDNRERFYLKITELKRNYEQGLDLFCYLGSWGMTGLMAGVKHFDFVDQADMGDALEVNLQKNHLMGRGDFHRSDAFNFLDQRLMSLQYYDVIVSDPPPFAKSSDKKTQALIGYKKLHYKILKLINNGGMVCFASCTHYVSREDFVETIEQAAKQAQKKLTLIDEGTQAKDHPYLDFKDKSYYLKYFAYVVE